MGESGPIQTDHMSKRNIQNTDRCSQSGTDAPLGEIHLLPEEQKTLRKGRRGYPDALAIDQAISKERRDRVGDMSVAWLDFRKTYDLVPHRVIKDVLKSCTVPQWIQQLLEVVMPMEDISDGLEQGQGAK